MIKIKKVFTIVFLIFSVLFIYTSLFLALFSDSSSRASASSTESFYMSDKESIEIWTDPITKVQYVCYVAAGRGGICPRYLPDGSLMIGQ